MSISGDDGADEVRLLIRRPDFGDGFEARVMCKDRVTGNVYAVHQYQMQLVDPGHAPRAAVLRLDAGAVQSLMDDLWAAGVRPSRSVSREDEMKALRDHLRDLQTIAFYKLGIPREAR